MRKCPKCGCDSQDSAQWCDVCVEPFDKLLKDASAQEQSYDKEPKRQEKKPLQPLKEKEPHSDTEIVLGKIAASVLEHQSDPSKPIEIPPEFFRMEPSDKIPTFPAWYRHAAWAILGFWVIAGMMLLGFYLAKHSAQEDDIAIQRRFSQNR